MNPLAIFAGPYGFLIKWGIIAALVLSAMAWSAMKMHQHDQVVYDELAREYGIFKAGVAAAGEKAERDRQARIKEDKKAKEKADAENARTVADLRSTIAGLRGANPSRSVLPAVPSGSSRPDLACFDREQYLREDGVLTAKLFAGARGLADEGTASTVDLNTAKRWGQGRNP